MQITTNTLKRMRKALTFVLLSLSLTAIAACDEVATAVAQTVAPPSSESQTVAVLSGRVVELLLQGHKRE